MISKLRYAIGVLVVRPATWLKSISLAAILALIAVGVSAGPALANTIIISGNWPHKHPGPHHYPVPVGTTAGGLGVAAIAGIGLLVAQRRRRHTVHGACQRSGPRPPADAVVRPEGKQSPGFGHSTGSDR
jgi:hypothetical protein